LGNQMAVARNIPGLSARPLHLIRSVDTLIGDDTIFSRAGINTVIRQPQADAERARRFLVA
jgi:hypothetical protein